MDFAASSPITIEHVSPQISAGRYAVKREVGDTMEVWANIFKDGHDLLKAVILCRRADSDEWWEAPMWEINHGLALWGGDLWFGDNTRYIYTIEAWVDEFGTWRDGTTKKREAGQGVALELVEGADIVRKTLERLKKTTEVRDFEAREHDIAFLTDILARFDACNDEYECANMLMSEEVLEAMDRWPDREKATRYDRELEVFVDRPRARFGAWYEMDVRSQGTEPGVHGTFKDGEARLPEIREMGFDVDICCRYTRSVIRTAKAKIIRWFANRATSGRRMRSVPKKAGTKPFTRSWEQWTISVLLSAARGNWIWKSLWTSPYSVLRITRGSKNTPNGLLSVRTVRSSTRKIRRKNIRISSTSIFTARKVILCG